MEVLSKQELNYLINTVLVMMMMMSRVLTWSRMPRRVETQQRGLWWWLGQSPDCSNGRGPYTYPQCSSEPSHRHQSHHAIGTPVWSGKSRQLTTTEYSLSFGTKRNFHFSNCPFVFLYFFHCSLSTCYTTSLPPSPLPPLDLRWFSSHPFQSINPQCTQTKWSH